ncbi:MAG: hydroxyisourate hydrolase [Acidobacteriota bacterium]
MSHLTTHILDTARGRPAANVSVLLEHQGDRWIEVARGTTDGDGRVGELGPERLASGIYRLTFAVGDYFAARKEECFYPEVQVTFRVDEKEAHYHVPLLLNPFGYSTYRGS